jgi:hypothetical protein
MTPLNDIHVLALLPGTVRCWLGKTLNVDPEEWATQADTTILFDVDDTARADQIGRLFGLSLCRRVSGATTTDGQGHRVFTIVVDHLLVVLAVPRTDGYDMLPIVNARAPDLVVAWSEAVAAGIDWDGVAAAVGDLMFAYGLPTGQRH